MKFKFGMLALFIAFACLGSPPASADTPEKTSAPDVKQPAPSVGYVFLGKCDNLVWTELHVTGLPSDCVVSDTSDVRFKAGRASEPENEPAF